MKHPETAWIGVDFDRTLALYKDWETNGSSLGAPIPLMLERVKRWLAKGQEVRIFTARVASSSDNREENEARIKQWCLEHLGVELKVTAEKDYSMVELWDDRAVSVMPNEGYCNSDQSSLDPLTTKEELKLWKQRRGDEDDE